MAIVMKSGKKVTNYLSGEKNAIKFKKAALEKLKLSAPLVSWPKDKESLLNIINMYLSQVELDKLGAVVDLMEMSKNEDDAIKSLMGGDSKPEESKTEEEKSALVENSETVTVANEEQKADDKNPIEENGEVVAETEVTEEDAIKLQEQLTKKFPQCEFNAVCGGQPVYYYILSIE